MENKNSIEPGGVTTIKQLLPARTSLSGWRRTLLLFVLCANVVFRVFGGKGKFCPVSLKFAVLLLISVAPWFRSIAQQATWIWYPGDFEISLANHMQNRRTERDVFLPVFWKMDSHYVLVEFGKTVELAQPEEVLIRVEGTYNVKLDGKAFEGSPQKIKVPAGRHYINIKVFNEADVPAIFLQGTTLVSDASWLVTFENKEWIDASGKTSDVSATTWVKAGHWNFNKAAQLPSAFALPVKNMNTVAVVKENHGLLADFGRETFGFLQLHGLRGTGKISVYYGESKEEALSADHCETLDRLDISIDEKKDTTLRLSKAFRYINLQYDAAVSVDSVSMLHEYADIPDKGSFSCSDTLINTIYGTARYTLHLSTREFFVDGIKRDRWVWSGDAYQSYLMNYYLMNDNETVKRTIYALRGKDPVTSHVNTIMDYTFYWFMSIYDYYLYSGDTAFLQQNYPRMQSLMAFCLNRRNKDGLMEGQPGDWIFIDWANGLSKQGEVSFEQLLLCRSLETMALCAGIANDHKAAGGYQEMAVDLKKKLFDFYWNESRQALVHSRINGKQTDNITRYANMFAIFFGYFSDAQKQAVKKSVLLNDSIQQITTPYMRFYELEALCALGEQPYVLKQMKEYWGGMLKAGATSFWEEYDPAKKGAAHYAMYGRPFGKSLCHAWGASPLYLLGKYYLGIKPTAAGYANYLVAPNLGGLQWMQGKVPTPAGAIDLYCSTTQVKIKSPVGNGLLRITSKTKPAGKNIVVNSIGDNKYEINIQPGIEYVINYKAM
jgi:alpha-L-rhamnosidase